MSKKRILKRKYRIILDKIKKTSIIVLILLIVFFFSKTLFKEKKYIESINIKNNILTINLIKNNNIKYCSLDKNNWIEIKDNKCIIEYNTNSNIYFKNDKKIIYESNKDIFYKIKEIDTLYLANNDEYNPFIYIIGNADRIKYNNYDNRIIKIENNNIKSIKEGKTTLNINVKDNEYKINIIVTNLITNRPTEGYDFKKPYLSCNKYSENESDLLDLILKSKINNVGYKTRAAAVEAARFLTLDFPYRINYFYENGRQTTNKVDGEGRYYHEGLYLNSKKFSSLTGSTTTNNKNVWGCSIYSYPAKRNIDNGLDCSGFVSWALLNAGFDVKDVGAGWSDKLDLTDYGEVKKLSKELALSNEIRVGDLLHSEAAGGHIGIIVGIDKNNYYVAQALWYDEIGVIITKYKKDKLNSSFPHVVLMDKYYIEDGILTNMW